VGRQQRQIAAATYNYFLDKKYIPPLLGSKYVAEIVADLVTDLNPNSPNLSFFFYTGSY
jgi:hypothetical protein